MHSFVPSIFFLLIDALALIRVHSSIRSSIGSLLTTYQIDSSRTAGTISYGRTDWIVCSFQACGCSVSLVPGSEPQVLTTLLHSIRFLQDDWLLLCFVFALVVFLLLSFLC
jgi:hypothetical protein